MQWSFISGKRCSPGAWIAAGGMAVLILGSSGGPTRFHPMKTRSGRHGLARIHEHRSADGICGNTNTTNPNCWQSDNWSGYAIAATSGSLPNGSVTMASGSWVVPTATCSSSQDDSEGYASFWVGIDGWSSNSVEQIGTDSDCVNPATSAGNSPSYYAWFEFYPQGAYYIGNPSNNFAGASVQPGDVISTQVNATGNGNFTATISDTKQGWTFSTTGHVRGAQQTSAEWIAEAPCCGKKNTVLPLADFALADYGDYFTGNAQTCMATVQGVLGPIGSFGQNIQQTTMVSQGARGGSPAGTIMAQPYPAGWPPALMGNGTSFSIQWQNSGP